MNGFTHGLAFPSLTLLVDAGGAVLELAGDQRALADGPVKLGATPLAAALGAEPCALLLELALVRARRGGRVELALDLVPGQRGATVAEPRRLALRVAPAGGGRCQVTAIVLRAADPADPGLATVPTRAPGPAGTPPIACRSCGSVEDPERRLPLEDAVRVPALFSQLAAGDVQLGLCSSCAGSA